MIQIFRRANLYLNPLFNTSRFYGFSKASQNPSERQNQNYIKSRQPIIKVQESQKESTIPDTITNDTAVMKRLILANFCLMCAIPFYSPINVGIGVLNGGFIMSQIGQQLKKFLIIINNNHYQQLSNYKSLPIYSKIIMQNMLILGSQASFLAFSQYYLAHSLTIMWYILSFYNKNLPSNYYPVVISLLCVILLNLFSKPLLELLEEKKNSLPKQAKP